jgi:hypothetical protein
LDVEGVNDGVCPFDVAQADGSPRFAVVVGVEDGGGAVVVDRYRVHHLVCFLWWLMLSEMTHANPNNQINPNCHVCHAM